SARRSTPARGRSAFLPHPLGSLLHDDAGTVVGATVPKVRPRPKREIEVRKPRATNRSSWKDRCMDIKERPMADPLALLIDRIATPTGEMILVADEDGNLRTIDWTDHEARMKKLLDRQYGKGSYSLKPARDPGGLSSAMRRYFKGDLS